MALEKTADEKCTNFDTVCFQAIQDTIDSSKPAIQSRDLGLLIWIVETLAWPAIEAAAVEGGIGVFFPYLYKFREEGTQKVVTLVLPRPVVEQIPSLANASEIVVEGSSGPIGDITPSSNLPATVTTGYV